MTRETIHASCVAIDGRGVLIAGRSGSGKSDLALRLIDRGASLVCDDYTLVEARDGIAWASAPATIAGRIEVRHVGIVAMPHVAAPVALCIDLDAPADRLPEPARRTIAGIEVPLVALAGFEPSAPIKAELLLEAIGG